jgi:hypothetical protein
MKEAANHGGFAVGEAPIQIIALTIVGIYNSKFCFLRSFKYLRYVRKYLCLFEAKLKFCDFIQCHPRPSGPFMQDKYRVGGNGAQKDVINGGMFMRVSPNFVANSWINLYFEFFGYFPDCTVNRCFVWLDRATGEIPHFGKWYRTAATLVAELHKETTIGPPKKHRSGDAFAHARLALVLKCSSFQA